MKTITKKKPYKRFWTEDKIKSLIDHVNVGSQIPDIAKYFGTTSDAIRSQMARHKIKIPRVHQRRGWLSKEKVQEIYGMKGFMTITQAAKRAGVTPQQVSGIWRKDIYREYLTGE